VTQLDVAGRGYRVINEGTKAQTTLFDTRNGFDDTSFGVGDLLVRAKYRFGYVSDFGFAAGLTLRCPTGNDQNFHGIGDWTVQPTFIVSRAFGLNDVHANLGMEFNAADSERTQARYGIGATLQMEQLRWVALLVDILGNSGLDNEQFTQTVPFPAGASGTVHNFFVTSAQSSDGSLRVTSTLPRTDQVSIAVGLKFALWGNALGYLNAIVPLTQQGLQADVISAVGFEYSF
jgi:hypothetical protein